MNEGLRMIFAMPFQPWPLVVIRFQQNANKIWFFTLSFDVDLRTKFSLSSYVMTAPLHDESSSPFMKACSHLFGWVNIYPEPVPRLSPTLHLRPGKFPCPDSSWPEFVCNGLSTLSEEAAAFIWVQISASIWIICTIISSASQIQIQTQTQTCNKRPFSNRRCDEGQQWMFSLL